MKQQIENIIKENLPEKQDEEKIDVPVGADIGMYRHCKKLQREGFNQALSQINTSLIADEVLKVVVEKIKEKSYMNDFGQTVIDDVDDLLSTLSPNKENKNNT